MRILVIGSGGREHALTWKSCGNRRVRTRFFAHREMQGPAEIAENVAIAASDLDGTRSGSRRKTVSI